MSQPWLSRKEWSSPTLYSGAKTGMITLWVFTILFGGVSGLVLTLGFDELLANFNRGEYLVLLVGLFPLVSLLLLKQSWTMTQDWRRYGRTPFQMDPYPGAIGGQMGGYVDIRLPYSPANQFEATLALYRRTTKRSGNETRTDESVVWQRTVPLHSEACLLENGSGTRLRVLTDVPFGQSASEVPDRDYHLWRLSIKALDKSLRFKRQWEVPMFPGTAKASRPLPATAEAAYEDRQLQSLEDLTQITQQGDSVWMRFTPDNTRKMSWFMTLFGAIFFAIGAGMTQADASMTWLFVLVFGGVGLAIMLGGIYGLGKELRVGISNSEIVTKRFWFGRPLSVKQYPRAKASHMMIESSGSMSTGTETVQYYKLKLHLTDSTKVPLGFGIDGYGKAEKLAQQLSVLTQLKFKEG